MNSTISIFPLNLVLFPDAYYSLHIFENRYKIMIAECLSQKEGFGIVSVIDENVAEIGSYVEISQVTKIHENNDFDIIVQAKSRFLTISSETNSIGFLEAFVAPFEDSITTEVIQSKEEEAISLFTQIIEKSKITIEDSFWKNLRSAPLKSFKIAEKAGLTLKQQQDLLSSRNENERLDILLNHLQKVETFLETEDYYKDIIAGDGYINF